MGHDDHEQGQPAGGVWIRQSGDEFPGPSESHPVNPPIPRRRAVTTTASRISQISLVIVPATDQDRSIEFYEGALGFEKRTDIPFGDKYRWVEVYPPSGNKRKPRRSRFP